MTDQEIHIDVTRTKADYLWAIVLHTVRNPRVWTIYTIGAFIVALIASAVAEVDDSVLPNVLTFLTAFLLMMLVYALIVAGCLVSAVMKTWRQPGAFAVIHYGLSPTGLSVSHETGKGESKWIVWKSFFETRSLFVIRHQVGLLQIIPKRTLNDDTIDRIRSLLRVCLGPQRKEAQA